jgi:hypothetical protein
MMRAICVAWLLACVGCSPNNAAGEENRGEGEGEREDRGGEGEGEGEGEGDQGEGEGEGEAEPTPRIVSSPLPGGFRGAPGLITLRFEPSRDDVVIHATVDGTTPTSASPALTFTELAGSALIRAVAVDANGEVLDGFAGVYASLDESAANLTSQVPLMLLWSNTEPPVQKEDNYTSFSVTVFDTAAGPTTLLGAASLSTRAGIRIRGSSTAGGPKFPWRVEAWKATNDDDKNIALLGMPAEADWILGAPFYFDGALMRSSLAYAWSNDIGRYAPRSRFAEVFLVGGGRNVSASDSIGVYEVLENIERGTNRVPITALNSTDVTEPNVSGGYIWKEDRLGPGDNGFYAGNQTGALQFQQSFVMVEPREAELPQAQLDYVVNELNDLGWALTSPGFTSPQSGLHYRDIIDVDSFIDHHIINLLTKNPDAFRLSGYMHKDRGQKITAGPVWDFDRTMGCNNDDRAADPTGWDAGGDGTPMFDHGFYGGLFDDPEFQQAYWARLASVLAGPLSVAAMHERIDAWAQPLAEAAARNFARWPEVPPRGAHIDEVNLLKEWLRARHDWMSECLAQSDPIACE